MYVCVFTNQYRLSQNCTQKTENLTHKLLTLTLPLQDDSLPSNLLTVHKMELVFSFGTHSHIVKRHTHTFIEYTQLSICCTLPSILSTLQCKIENTIIEMEHTRLSHFSFCKMSQCRPTFFIVKHKTAHKYAAKKVLFR